MSQLTAGLTDVVFCGAMIGCAVRSAPVPTRFNHRYWPATFWAGAASAFIGVLHHLAFAGSRRWADASWDAVGVALCLSLSALLAATATEVLSPATARNVIRVRSFSLILYVIAAIMGRGNLSYLLACESVTILAVLGLWVHGERIGHPLAGRILQGIAVMAVALIAFSSPMAAVGDALHLDAGAMEHLLQIPGMFLVVRALRMQPQQPSVRGPVTAGGAL